MRFWVGVTDKSWFNRLHARSPEEVNFWQPSPKRVASFLRPGTPFLFKLHYPDNYIVGGGFFLSFSVLPARLAWEAFGEKNGVQDYAELRARVLGYRPDVRGDPQIGCNILNGPFFFPEEEWIPVPQSWSANIVRGRTFDTTENDGLMIWNAITKRLQRASDEERANAPRYGMEYLTQARIGQGAFRVLVTDAYDRKCAVTGERTLPVLEAAHIRPYARGGPHLISNGLLLRSDLHKLFDDGYLTVDESYRVVVSKRIREEFQNGREYYRFSGARLTTLPKQEDYGPSREFLLWHNEHIYLD